MFEKLQNVTWVLIVQILDLHKQQGFNIRVIYTIYIYTHEVHKT